MTRAPARPSHGGSRRYRPSGVLSLCSLVVGTAVSGCGGASKASTTQCSLHSDCSSATDAAASRPTQGQAATASCADGGTPTVAFDDDFSAGLRSTYWTVDQNVAGLFSIDATQGDVLLTKTGSNADSTLRGVEVVFNLATVGGPVTGDFEYSVDFSDALLGPSGVDQVELHALFADATLFLDVYDNNSGLNVHVWTGSINGMTSTAATGGTFRLARVGSTLTGYLGDTPIYSTTSTSALSDVRFVLQLQPGSNDPISVRYDNFHFQSGCAP